MEETGLGREIFYVEQRAYSIAGQLGRCEELAGTV